MKLTRITTMVFSIFLSLLTFVGCQTSEDEVIIVPKNYTGYLIIIYNQKDGEPPKHIGKKRVYEFTSDGILKTQFPENSGWKNLPEFYYEKMDPQNKIPYSMEKKLPKDKTVAYGGTAGSITRDEKGEDVVRYLIYYVGNEAQIDTAYEAAEKLDIDSLIK
jgi:hypothetical protein